MHGTGGANSGGTRIKGARNAGSPALEIAWLAWMWGGASGHAHDSADSVVEVIVWVAHVRDKRGGCGGH
jgi:hypothetical protein